MGKDYVQIINDTTIYAEKKCIIETLQILVKNLY